MNDGEGWLFLSRKEWTHSCKGEHDLQVVRHQGLVVKDIDVLPSPPLEVKFLLLLLAVLPE